MTPARITIRSRGTAPEADNREHPEKERAKATAKALALPTALLSWTGRSAVGKRTSRASMPIVLLAIPDDLGGHVLAPRAFKGASIVTGPYQARCK